MTKLTTSKFEGHGQPFDPSGLTKMHTDIPNFQSLWGHFCHISIQNKVNPPCLHFLRWLEDMKTIVLVFAANNRTICVLCS